MRARVPDPAKEKDEFIRAALSAGERARRNGSRLVAFPTSDRVIKILSDHRETFAEVFDLYLPERKALNRCLDKLEQYRACDELGIPYPLTYSDGEESRLLSDLECGRVSTPLFFKARISLPDEESTRRFRRVPLSTRTGSRGASPKGISRKNTLCHPGDRARWR
jgi:predicted ATP-grasp superfamily ATP-dependent carboligase